MLTGLISLDRAFFITKSPTIYEIVGLNLRKTASRIKKSYIRYLRRTATPHWASTMLGSNLPSATYLPDL